VDAVATATVTDDDDDDDTDTDNDDTRDTQYRRINNNNKYHSNTLNYNHHNSSIATFVLFRTIPVLCLSSARHSLTSPFMEQ